MINLRLLAYFMKSVGAVKCLACCATVSSIMAIGCTPIDSIASQPTELVAIHRDGQTFLTWREPKPQLTDPSTTVGDIRKLLKEFKQKPPTTTYRIYRSDRPITSVKGLQSVGETDTLSCWNRSLWSTDRNTADKDPALRYVIEEGKPALAPGTGLYVHNPQLTQSSTAFYAVTVVENGTENIAIGPGNALQSAVAEVPGMGTPVLQSEEKRDEFQFVKVHPTLQYYVRWEAPPNANRENMPNDLLVAIPSGRERPTSLGLHLHCWGGSPWGGYGWWFNAERGAVLLAPNQDPYDWWTGYHELFGIQAKTEANWRKGKVYPYTQRRLLSLTDWAIRKWQLDPDQTFVAGNSMGGSGAPMMALRHPDQFAWAVSWVGVHVPELSPKFKASYAAVYGEQEWKVLYEDGSLAWEYFNDAAFLRRYPERETPFITFANGKNDAGIGWEQATEFVKALQETKRPHLFVWGQNEHNQRAVMPKSLEQQINPLQLRVRQSVPAFTRCSLDGNPGNGSPDDGDSTGGINMYLFWDTDDIVDTDKAWEMTIQLVPKSPESECTVDLTPRRLQAFKLQPGERLRWSNREGKKTLQSGNVTVDQYGLATLEGLQVSKTGNRIRIER